MNAGIFFSFLREHTSMLSSPSVASHSSSNESLIFYPRPSPPPSVPHNTPTHMAAYNAHSRLISRKYQFQPIQKAKSTLILYLYMSKGTSV